MPNYNAYRSVSMITVGISAAPQAVAQAQAGSWKFSISSIVMPSSQRFEVGLPASLLCGDIVAERLSVPHDRQRSARFQVARELLALDCKFVRMGQVQGNA